MPKAFLFISQPSLDPDTNAVTHIPGDGFGPDIVERRAAEAVKANPLIGKVELLTERIASQHLQKPCRVSVLDRMQHLTSEAEVSALAQAAQMLILRPYLESRGQPAQSNPSRELFGSYRSARYAR
jgi:hypothetical protein